MNGNEIIIDAYKEEYDIDGINFCDEQIDDINFEDVTFKNCKFKNVTFQDVSLKRS